jgi:plasmid stability protein
MSLTIDLPEEVQAELRRRAEAEGVSMEECASILIAGELGSLEMRPSADRRMTVAEVTQMILDRTGDVPAEAFEESPRDGASQHDHYIYGTPKRQDL